jgi:hypothetical protein
LLRYQRHHFVRQSQYRWIVLAFFKFQR